MGWLTEKRTNLKFLKIFFKYIGKIKYEAGFLQSHHLIYVIIIDDPAMPLITFLN